MNIQVKLFAGIAETLKTNSISITVADASTVEDLVIELKRSLPQASHQFDRALVAVNRTYAAPRTQLQETDEVALIPPVGGGAPEDFAHITTSSSCLISAKPLDLQAAYAFLEDAHCGGTVLFCGSVREWTHGRQTQYLDYQAYVDMALSKMDEIARTLQDLHPDAKTLQWHRIGVLNPTDIAVICGASAPHRDAAFTLARTLIDRLKKEVPIWKKEVYADGSSTWQENP